MPLLARNAQIAVKAEGTEGTAESLTSAEAKQIIYSPTFATSFGMHKRKPARASLSPLPAITTKQLGSLKYQTEFKGSGAVGTAPAWSAAFLGCGAQQSVVKTIAIGSVTSGPFQPMETITGGTSAATGRVVGECSATPLKYVALSGTFQSGETVTGGTSGASATTGGTPQDNKGFEYTPDSSTPTSVTAALYQDGLKKTLAGARGTWTLSATVDSILMCEFDFQGVYGGVTDTALLSGVTYEATTPPAFLGLSFNVGGYTSPVFTNFKLSCGNTLTSRDSVTASKGALSVYITDREATGSVDPEAVAVATQDWYGKLVSGATGRLYTSIGTAAGEVITIASPRIRFTNVQDGDRNGLVLSNLDFEMLPATDSILDGDWQVAMS